MILSYNRNDEYNSKISRYKILRKVTEDSDIKTSYLETQNQRFIKESDKDIYHIVKNNEVNRLDIISFHYYGTPALWWAIALANEFIDPFVVNQGDIIRIPSLVSLNDPSQRILARK